MLTMQIVGVQLNKTKNMKNTFIGVVNELIEWGKASVPDFEENELSDGYHTFNDLYEFRKQYNAALFNEWALTSKYSVHKSIRHFDGKLCFGGGWFIVVAMLPAGQITNHYKSADWDLFKIPAFDKAMFEFDGHTPGDVMIRLALLNLS